MNVPTRSQAQGAIMEGWSGRGGGIRAEPLWLMVWFSGVFSPERGCVRPLPSLDNGLAPGQILAYAPDPKDTSSAKEIIIIGVIYKIFSFGHLCISRWRPPYVVETPVSRCKPPYPIENLPYFVEVSPISLGDPHIPRETLISHKRPPYCVGKPISRCRSNISRWRPQYLVGDHDTSLETPISRWRFSYLFGDFNISLETPISRWRLPYLVCRPPYLVEDPHNLVGDPHISLKTSIFFWKTK